VIFTKWLLVLSVRRKSEQMYAIFSKKNAQLLAGRPRQVTAYPRPNSLSQWELAGYVFRYVSAQIDVALIGEGMQEGD